MRPFALAVCVAALGIGCGDDDDSSDTTGSAGGQRYCQLSREGDRAGEKFFAKLEKQNASPQEFAAAEREFAEMNRELLDEIVQAAPSEIRTDVEQLRAAVLARAKLGPPVDEKKAAAAEQSVQAYEKRNC